MELCEVIEKRQSVRRYADIKVLREDVLEMVEAARLAPSGKNLQNWHFIVIEQDELKKKIANTVLEKNEEISLKLDKINADRGIRFRKFVKNFTLFFENAPALVVVMSEKYTPSGYIEMQDTGYSQAILEQLMSVRSPGMQSLGAAIEHFYLRAVELGYGLCWLTSANYAYEAIESIVREETEFSKEGYFMAALLSLGIPEGDIKSPIKKSLESIVTFS